MSEPAKKRSRAEKGDTKGPPSTATQIASQLPVDSRTSKLLARMPKGPLMTILRGLDLEAFQALLAAGKSMSKHLEDPLSGVHALVIRDEQEFTWTRE